MFAKQFKVYRVAGTVSIAASTINIFIYSRCVFNPNGKLIVRYDKFHLFDVKVSDITRSNCESDYTQAGITIA